MCRKLLSCIQHLVVISPLSTACLIMKGRLMVQRMQGMQKEEARLQYPSTRYLGEEAELSHAQRAALQTAHIDVKVSCAVEGQLQIAAHHGTCCQYIRIVVNVTPSHKLRQDQSPVQNPACRI